MWLHVIINNSFTSQAKQRNTPLDKATNSEANPGTVI